MNKSPFIITRAREDSAELTKFVKEQGFNAVLCPLTEIDYSDIDWEPYLKNEKINVIFTSYHAAKAFPWKNLNHIEHLFFIGKHSFQKIKEDFPNALSKISHAHLYNTINELVADFNVKKIEYKDLKIYYFRGQHIRQDLNHLYKDFIDIEDVVVYEAKELPTLPEDLQSLLQNQKKAIVSFMSKRAVEIWFETLLNYNLINSCRNLITLSFSKAIHETVLEHMVCYDNYYCIEPSYKAFCQLIKRLKD